MPLTYNNNRFCSARQAARRLFWETSGYEGPAAYGDCASRRKVLTGRFGRRGCFGTSAAVALGNGIGEGTANTVRL